MSPTKIFKNRGYSFVFAQRNAETALVSKTKGFKAGDRLFRGMNIKDSCCLRIRGKCLCV